MAERILGENGLEGHIRDKWPFFPVEGEGWHQTGKKGYRNMNEWWAGGQQSSEG